MGNPTNRASGGMGLLRPEVLVKAGKSESPPLIRPVAGTCLAEKGPRAPPPQHGLPLEHPGLGTYVKLKGRRKPFREAK